MRDTILMFLWVVNFYLDLGNTTGYLVAPLIKIIAVCFMMIFHYNKASTQI